MRYPSLLLAIVMITICSCSSKKDEKKTESPRYSYDRIVSSHKYKNAYIDKLDILHVDYLSIKYKRPYREPEDKDIQSFKWVMCPHINLGYKQILLDSLKQTDIQYVCPYCITKETYSNLFLEQDNHDFKRLLTK